MTKKIQLNDEQWRTLEALRDALVKRRPTHTIKVSSRLRSNGLVTTDHQAPACSPTRAQPVEPGALSARPLPPFDLRR